MYGTKKFRSIGRGLLPWQSRLVANIKLHFLCILELSFLLFSSHAITSDISISDVAAAAELFLSDGVIVTGSSTGQPASKEELKRKTIVS